MAAGNVWRDSVNYTANKGIWASNGATVMGSAGTTPGRRHSVKGITHRPRLVLAAVLRCVAMVEVRQRRDGSAGSLPARRHLSLGAAAPTPAACHRPPRPPQRWAAAQLRHLQARLAAQA
jgi:hypothetical protein